MNRSVLNKAVPISYGHGEFFIEFLYKAKHNGVKILEIPFTQPPDKEGMTKTAPNVFRFIYLSYFYITRIVLSLMYPNCKLRLFGVKKLIPFFFLKSFLTIKA